MPTCWGTRGHTVEPEPSDLALPSVTPLLSAEGGKHKPAPPAHPGKFPVEPGFRKIAGDAWLAAVPQ